MQNTILLTRYELGPKISRYLFFIFGISQSMQGIRYLDDTPLTTGDLIFGRFLLLTEIFVHINNLKLVQGETVAESCAIRLCSL